MKSLGGRRTDQTRTKKAKKDVRSGEKDGTTTIRDDEGRVVFSSPDQGYIVHHAEHGITVDKVADMSDCQLVLALANAVRPNLCESETILSLQSSVAPFF